jgi:hypothetical protein
MSRRLLDYDAESGVQTWHSYDQATEVTTIETVQDVEPWIEAAKELQKDDDYKRRGMKNEWLHVACIPIGVQYKWLKEHGVDVYKREHLPKVKRLLNDPDWRYLRTTTGRL